MYFTDLHVTENLPDGKFRYGIPQSSKMRFGESGIIMKNFLEEQIGNVYEFAYEQGKNLNQKENWPDGTKAENRTPFEMFLDTFNGKMGEVADVMYFDLLGILNGGVDYSITGKGDGDGGSDIVLFLENRRLIVASRTIPFYGNLLLLETSKSFLKCYATILNRIKCSKQGSTENTLQKLIPSHLRTSDFNEKHKQELFDFIKGIRFQVELVGKLPQKEYERLEKREHTLFRGDYFMYTFIKTHNRYVCAGDLLKLKEI